MYRRISSRNVRRRKRYYGVLLLMVILFIVIVIWNNFRLLLRIETTNNNNNNSHPPDYNSFIYTTSSSSTPSSSNHFIKQQQHHHQQPQLHRTKPRVMIISPLFLEEDHHYDHHHHHGPTNTNNNNVRIFERYESKTMMLKLPDYDYNYQHQSSRSNNEEGRIPSGMDESAEHDENDDEEEEVCQQQQTLTRRRITIHPICNMFHEYVSLQWWDDEKIIDYRNNMDNNNILNLLSMYGTWRSAWLVQSTTTTTTTTTTQQSYEDDVERLLVLKVLHMNRRYNKSNFLKHQRDAMIMEILHSSPYTISSYGFCGQSVLVDYAYRDGLFIRHKIGGRQKQKNTVPWKRRLIMARDLAFGLQHIHKQHIAHGDIKLVNAIVGTSYENNNKEYFQWNDFNFGVFLNINSNNNSTATTSSGSCGDGHDDGIPAISTDGVWRCPEELTLPGGDTKQTNAKKRPKIKHYDKCDIYMFGNTMVELLTGKEPWYYNYNNESNANTAENNPASNLVDEMEIRKLKYSGIRPKLPDSIMLQQQDRQQIMKIGNQTIVTQFNNNNNNNGMQKKMHMGAAKKRNNDLYRLGVIAAFIETMNLCFQHNPDQRPTAYQIGMALNSTLDILLSSTGTDESPQKKQSMSELHRNNRNNNTINIQKDAHGAIHDDVADQIQKLFRFGE